MQKLNIAKIMGGVIFCATLSACEDASDKELRFSASPEDNFVLTSECVQNSTLNKDPNGVAFVSFDVRKTPECYELLDTWIQDHMGEEVSLIFGKERVSGPSKVLSHLPAEDIRITSENTEILSKIQNSLSSD